jgi:hypothetical protein
MPKVRLSEKFLFAVKNAWVTVIDRRRAGRSVIEEGRAQRSVRHSDMIPKIAFGILFFLFLETRKLTGSGLRDSWVGLVIRKLFRVCEFLRSILGCGLTGPVSRRTVIRGFKIPLFIFDLFRHFFLP